MNNDECIFCKIANHEIPAQIVYEDEELLAFEDINPVAPCHLLIIPKKHIPTMDDLSEKDEKLVGRMLLLLTRLARKSGVHKDGYRQVINCNKDGGQVVYHLHAHLIGGRPMRKMG